MQDYTGTTWERTGGTTQGALIVIIGDAHAPSSSTSRPLRAKREIKEGGGRFWISPRNLEIKYRQTQNLSIPNTKTRDPRLIPYEEKSA